MDKSGSTGTNTTSDMTDSSGIHSDLLRFKGEDSTPFEGGENLLCVIVVSIVPYHTVCICALVTYYSCACVPLY